MVLKRNCKECSGISWSLGDKIEINLPSIATRSRIDLPDKRSNVQYFSIHVGKINILITKISDVSRYCGDCSVLPSVRNKDDVYNKNYSLKVWLGEVISDNSSNGDPIAKNSGKHTEKQESIIYDMVEEDGYMDQTIGVYNCFKKFEQYYDGSE